MTISSILGTGLSALLANQAALRTTSANISNVNTPGYVRRITNFETQAPGGQLGGVNIASTQRVVDGFIEGQRRAAAAGSGASSVSDRFLDQLQHALGGIADGRDPGSRLSALSSSLAGLTTDPTSLSQRTDAISKMRDFANGISDLANQTQTLRGQADQEIGQAVTRINQLIRQISDLNGPIQQATVSGDTSTALRDQRDNAVRELSGLIAIQVDENASGRITVSTPNGLSLVGSNITLLSHQDSGTTTASTVFPGISAQRINPTTGDAIGPPESLEAAVSGGTLRGLLDLRDKTLPNIAQQIGEMAAGAAESFNAASNASSTYPAPASLNGRATGLLAGDALNFTGKTAIAIVDAQGKLVRRVNVDFSAGTLAVDGGAATSIGTSVGSFVSALNTALGGTGSASFVNGALTLSASGGNGVAVQQDPTSPSSRAGRGFAQTFGLNDIFTAAVPTSFATGLSAGDAHGFGAGQQATFQLRNADGSSGGSFSYAVSGSTIGDMVSGLNTAAAGKGTFALDAQGRMTFTAAGGATQRLELVNDGTVRGGTNQSLSTLFGLGQSAQMLQATSLQVRSDLAQSPAKLPLAQLDLTGSSAIGDVVLAAGDIKGLTALQAASSSSVAFNAAGTVGALRTSLSQYASGLVAGIGQASAVATADSADADAYQSQIETRAASVSGVNLDEELSNMIVFQQAYNAGARLITTAQALYDALLEMVR